MKQRPDLVSFFFNMSNIRISVITSLYRAENFLEKFLQYVQRIDNPSECEFIFIHNDPSEYELQLINAFIATGFTQVNHISVARESLYSSWNRAIKLAKGEYLAVWNVDDIRIPSSLSAQCRALDNSNAVMCYGDFYATVVYGEHQQEYFTYDADYGAIRTLAQRNHIVGCFPMWKKIIHEQVGYYDEQFRLVSDWDFQLRVARVFDLVKADEYLGYYLTDVPHKLSSNRSLQYKEQTVVLLRYKLYSRILMHCLLRIRKYKVNAFLNFGEWQQVNAVLGRENHAGGNLAELLPMPFVYFSWCVKKVSSRIAKKLGGIIPARKLEVQ